MPSGYYPRPSLRTRFRTKINKRGPIHPVLKSRCWIWVGALSPYGYGVMSYKGKAQHSHRISWLLHRRSSLGGFFVLHHCDNKRCVNPNHLFLGTSKDNYDDMVKKGRYHDQGAQGDHNRNVKLLTEQVFDVRSRYIPKHPN